jgi:hypothetical protein
MRIRLPAITALEASSDEQEVQQLFFLGHGQDIFGLQAVVDAVLQQSDALIGESG